MYIGWHSDPLGTLYGCFIVKNCNSVKYYNKIRIGGYFLQVFLEYLKYTVT